MTNWLHTAIDQQEQAQRNHRHRPLPSRRAELSYSPTGARRENPAAHGNICVLSYCRCGAQRLTAVNGLHEERGPWILR